jgi:hypothetical protein
MVELMSLLFVAGVMVTAVAIVGHILWLCGAAVFRFVFDVNSASSKELCCENCGGTSELEYCPFCGCRQLNRLLADLSGTERTLQRLHSSQRIEDQTYAQLQSLLRDEHLRLTRSEESSPRETQAPAANFETPDEQSEEPTCQRSLSVTILFPEPTEEVRQRTPSFRSITEEPDSVFPETEPIERTPPRPRRSFSDMLNSFMEESNIRWGEIIGGLLIIGCSTALVVSLWAQIPQIPVAKFLIFTTVTAVLFGIGLYTEHRWKLPNTSLGILTIATLLVPLNFLAIAAVSSNAASGNLILVSEVIAPAVFLILIYYAGRVITPGCAGLLASGMLLSSIGQLLVRHFATPETTGFALVLLGGAPVVCFLATVGLALKNILAKHEMNESEVRTLFTMLGTMSFASALPFGLLLHKAGPLGMTMMYLAPTVTMWGLPLLLNGVVLWQQVRERERVATRTTGGTLAILGVVIAIVGVVLAWPNPASVVPSGLITFLVLTAIAVTLEVPVGHLIAALCLALVYTVTFHVAAGNVPWTNLRVFSLLEASLSPSTGSAMAGICFAFLITSEWLRRRRRQFESLYYDVASGIIAAVSLGLVTAYGVLLRADFQSAWIVYFLFSIAAFWMAARRQISAASWIGSALMLSAAGLLFENVVSFSFPWQTAFLVHASLSAVAAVALLKRDRQSVIWRPLYFSSFVSAFAFVVCLFQANPWQVTSMQAERVFWLAAILLVLLWINRKQLLFTAFQVATTCGVILTVKAALQASDWYAYLPHAFLHPTGLLIQATVLLLAGLVWIALRIVCREAAQRREGEHWTKDAWTLLDCKYSLDRLLASSLLGAFLLLVVYAVASGVTQELAALGSDYNGYNLVGFPRQEALGMLSWIVLALLFVTMLGHAWERRRSEYILAAAVASASVVPLLAGLFEPQIAVASAWRWLAALYLLLASVALWNRKKIETHLAAARWPQLNEQSETLTRKIRTVVILFSLGSILFLTLYPSLRAVYYLPVRGPASGIFSFLPIEISYSIPFVVLALIFIGHSLRERSASFAFAAGAFLNAAVTIAHLLSVVSVSGLMDRVVIVRTLQLNAITCSLFALAWLIYRQRWQTTLNQEQGNAAEHAVHIQVTIAALLNALLIIPVAAAILLWPTQVGVGVTAVASPVGWLAWLTGIVAFALSKTRRKLTADNLFCALVSFGCLLAFVLAGVNAEMMTGLHALTVGLIATAWLLFAGSMLSEDTLQRFTFLAEKDRLRDYAVVAGAMGIVSALRPGLRDPSSDWWVILSVLTLSTFFAAIHSQTLRRRHLLVGAILLNLAGAIWWVSYAMRWYHGVAAFFQAMTVIVSLSGMLCVWLELRVRDNGEGSFWKNVAVHDIAALLSVFLLTVLVVVGLTQPNGESILLYFPNLAWTSVLSVAALFGWSLWDRRSRYAVAGLYIAGLLAIGLSIQQSMLEALERFALATVLLSVQALFASFLWRRRSSLLEIYAGLRIPASNDDRVAELGWLKLFNVLVVGPAAYLALTTIFQAESFGLRLTVAAAVMIHAITFGLFTDGSSTHRWQHATVAMFLLGTVFLGWAALTPFNETRLLDRGAILTAEMCAAVAVFGVWLGKQHGSFSDWTASVRRCLPWIIATAVAGMLFCLNVEIFDHLTLGGIRIQTATIFLLNVTCVAAALILVLAAVLPNHDPFQLPERGRAIYIYAAEVITALLFIHLRLTMPWLFGSFERYWPFIVMLIAYTGVLVGESLRRQEWNVVAQPLLRSGAFLPLLPILGFWIAESEVDYSAVLVVAGGLYGLLSLLRRSFRFGVIAAGLANASLWYYLQRTDEYQFLQHPQLWLIPVAFCVLLAVYLNEDDFTDDQLASTRYLALATIYLSSTADIVINGVATSPWLPVILGALSLGGIFGGILLKIRGMLVLGSTFLLFAILTIILYASENLGWTWLWYVAGIVTGATIIFMFAVFEKKRTEVLRLVEGMKEWER